MSMPYTIFNGEVPATLFRHRGVPRLWISTDCEGKTWDFSDTDREYENAERNVPLYEPAGLSPSFNAFSFIP